MDIQNKIKLQGPRKGRIGTCGGKRCQTCKFVSITNDIRNGTHKIKFNQTMDCNIPMSFMLFIVPTVNNDMWGRQVVHYMIGSMVTREISTM